RPSRIRQTQHRERAEVRVKTRSRSAACPNCCRAAWMSVACRQARASVSEVPSSLLPSESCSERTVHPVPLRQHAQKALVYHISRNLRVRRRLQFPLRIPREKVMYLLFVLLRLQRTGAVNEQAARAHSRCSTSQQTALNRTENGQV